MKTTFGLEKNQPAPRRPWYALYTRHQHEKAVARNLIGKGFEVFLPLYSTVHRWKDRPKRLDLPLFPCYVFLCGGLDRRVDIVATPGVYSLVGSGGCPSTIPEAQIEMIRRGSERGANMQPHPFLNCGDWVRVKSGPLDGIEGILVRKKKGFRLVLSLDLVEKSVALEVDAFAVERIEKCTRVARNPCSHSARMSNELHDQLGT